MGIMILLVDRTGDNIGLTSYTKSHASQLEPYFESTAYALRPLNLEVSRISINNICSKCVVHGIHTSVFGSDVASTIQETYPHLTMCQMPKWLFSPPKCVMKTHFSVVLFCPKTVNIDNFNA